MTYTLVIYGRQAPKGRPRLGRGGNIFTPRATRDFEDRIAWSCRTDRVWFGDQPLSVEIEFWATKTLRGDLDNFTKSLLDGLVKGGKIDDDRHVVRVEAKFVYGVDEDKTVVRIAAVEGAAA